MIMLNTEITNVDAVNATVSLIHLSIDVGIISSFGFPWPMWR